MSKIISKDILHFDLRSDLDNVEVSCTLSVPEGLEGTEEHSLWPVSILNTFLILHFSNFTYILEKDTVCGTGINFKRSLLLKITGD